MYDRSGLLAGRGALTPIEEAELPAVAPNGWDGLRVLHLQCLPRRTNGLPRR